MSRFEVVPLSKAQELVEYGYENRCYLPDTSEDGYLYAFILVLVDHKEECVIATDEGEPEDQSFMRDWSWVPGLLNKVDQEK